MYWLSWHYHIKDIAGAPYKIKKKRKTKRQNCRQSVVAGRQQLYCAVQSRSPSRCQTTTGKVQSSARDGVAKPFVPYQTSWQYSDGDTPNGVVECRWDRQKLRLSANIWFHRMLWTVRPPSAIDLAATDHGKLMTLVAGKWQRLLMAGDNDKFFMKGSLKDMPKTTEQHLIVHSGKSEA